MKEKTTVYMKADTTGMIEPVEKKKKEFDLLFYQFKNEKDEVYELHFWNGRDTLFEVKLPNGEFLYATTDIQEFEGNPFPAYENGALWEWIKQVLMIYKTRIKPVMKRFRYINSW